MSLRDAASLPQGVALFEADVIYEYVFGSLKDYLAVFKPDAQPPLYARFRYDIIKEHASLYQQRRMEERRQAAEAQLDDMDVLREATHDLPKALEGQLAAGEAERPGVHRPRPHDWLASQRGLDAMIHARVAAAKSTKCCGRRR